MHAVERLRLGPLDDLLRVVEQEHAEEDQAAVDGHRVQAGPERRGGRQEHGPCRTKVDVTFPVSSGRLKRSVVLTNRGSKDHPEADSQGSAHVEELLAGGAHGHSGQAAHNARRVPGGPHHQGSSQESEGGHHSAHHTLDVEIGTP